MKSVLVLAVVFNTLAARAESFLQCYVSYQGCSKLHLPCMPLLKDINAVKAHLPTAFALSPDPNLLVICSGWKSWKPVSSLGELKDLSDNHAKHWFVQVSDQAIGPLSRVQLKALRNGNPVDGVPTGYTLTPSSKIWSEVRMGKDSKFQKASEVLEIFFKVLNDEASDEDIIL
jgi:hypothetical protein